MPTIDEQFIKDLLKIQAWIAEAKPEEMENRKAVIDYISKNSENKDVSPKDKTKDFCRVGKFLIKSDLRPELKFEYDEDTFLNHYSEWNTKQQNCFEYEPVFKKKEYNKLSPEEKLEVDEVLVSKPKSPNLEIIEE